MKDKDKTHEQLIKEVTSLRRRIAELEGRERQQKKTEETLTKWNHEKTAILDSMSELVAYQDMRMRILWTNRAAAESVGVDPQQLVGRHCYEIWPQRQRPCVGCPVVKARKSGHPHEAEITTPDGRVWLIRGYPVRYTKGKVTGTVEVTLEITERKKAERQLRLLSSALEQSTEGLAVSDLKGNLLFVNNAFATMHGYPPEELVGKHLFIFHTPEQMPSVKAANRQIQETGEFRGEIWHVRRDGTVFPTLMQNSLLRDEAGNTIGMIGTIRDITDLKRAEEELQQLTHDLAERVKELNCLSIASRLMVEPDKSLNEIYQNIVHLIPAAWQYTDITCARITYGDRQFKTDNFKETKWKQSADIIVDSNKVGSLDVFYLQKKPEEHEGPFLKEERVLIDALAREIEVFIKRKQAGDALRESEVRFRTLFESIPDCVLVHDDEGTILHVNEVGAQQFEWSAKDLVGRNLRDIVTPENVASIADHVKEVHKVGWCRFETTYVSRSGWQITAEVNEHPIKFGKKKAILSVARDITERKRTEDALRETSLFLRNILDSSSSISIISTDLDQNILFWNKGAEDIFGYKAEEVINRHTVDILYPDEGDTKQTVEEIRSYILNKKRELRREIKEVTKDGRLLWINLTSTPRFDENKNVIGILGIGEDITDRKNIEDALRESEERYRAVIESQIDLISRYLPDTTLTFVNDAYCQFFGKTREELIGHSYMFMIAPEFREQVRKETEELSKAPRPLAGEYLNYRYDGKECWIQWVVQCISDENGRVVELQAVGRDITVRKNIENALRESEERFRRVVETMGVGLSAIDENGVLTYVNEYLAKMLGYSIDEMIGRPTIDFYYDEEIRRIQEEIFKKRRAGMRDPTPYEVTWRRKDGQRMYSILSPTPHFDADGRFTGSVAIHTDITERKRMEQKLRESEERFRRVVETMKVGLGAIDENGVLTYVNEYLAKMLGYSIDEMIGRPTIDFYYDEEIRRIQEEIFKKRRAGMRDPTPYEVTWRRKDGQKVYAILSPTPMFDADGHYTGSFAIHTDITERKQREEKLRETEERFRLAFENANTGVCLVDLEGNLTRVNNKMCEIFGYTKKELEHMTVNDIAHPEDIDKSPEFIQTTLQGETDRGTFEKRYLHKKGHVVICEVSSSLIHDAEGRSLYFISHVHDITDRKQSEEALHRSYQQMQKMLSSTVNALASTVEMKDQYTAGHQPRVTQLACAIAEEMGLAEEQIEGIRMAGLIHDIGKIVVPAEILNKPGPLTEIQYEMVKMHPRAAFDILKGIKFPWPVAEIVLQHHERMDGSGYPQGLSGEEIMIEARILAVANVVEAMISHRPYRAAYDIKEPLAEISKNKGILYDPAVVDACLKLFKEKRFTFEQVR